MGLLRRVDAGVRLVIGGVVACVVDADAPEVAAIGAYGET